MEMKDLFTLEKELKDLLIRKLSYFDYVEAAKLLREIISWKEVEAEDSEQAKEEKV